MSEAERWLAWLDGDRRDDGTREMVGTPYQAAQRTAARLYALEAEVRLLQAQKLEWNQRAVQERERYEKLREAAQAVVDWWMPENAKTRNFGQWFDHVLPDLREALGRPRSMADDPEIKVDERTPDA